MLEKKRNFQLLCPDVLGVVTEKGRIMMDQLQCAVGVFPQRAFINQPFEIITLLQNMMNQPMQVKIAIRLPTNDKKGAPAVIDTPKPQMGFTMNPGEVGVLRMPVTAHPPTQPGKDFPVRVAVRFRVPENAEYLRPPTGGAPPAVLEISPFKLQALREVAFVEQPWNESTDIVTGYFDLAPHRLTTAQETPNTRYEVLWTRDNMAQEMARAHARIRDARRLADSTAFSSSFGAFLTAVKDRFDGRGIELLPGEINAIAKLMAYTIDEAPRLEQGMDIEESRWFLALCQAIAAYPEQLEGEFDRNEFIAKHVFNEVLYEAVLMGFHVLEHKVKENLGTPYERLDYANRLLIWYISRMPLDLNYVYLPLVLGGLAINRLVRHNRMESPWDIVDELTEALNLRLPAADDNTLIVLHMLDEMLRQAGITLRNQRIDR